MFMESAPSGKRRNVRLDSHVWYAMMRSSMKPAALYILDPGSFEVIYGPAEQAAIARQVQLLGAPLARQQCGEQPDQLREVECIFSGWGAPLMDEKFLAAAPKLKVVFYGSGSIRGFVTDAFWQRGILVTSAYAANAVPVVEYTLAVVILSLKHFWQQAAAAKTANRSARALPVPGAYRSTVGVISLGMIGRQVCERLRAHDVRVLAYDPFATPAQAAALNVELCSLAEVFQRADVVTLHTPWLKETEGLITGAHFASLKPGATFINTARGAVVRETELIDVLTCRPDLQAVLDVTYPEPPAPESPLYTLPNVVLTPHIAGSMNAECRRMGQYMVDELGRYRAGQPLKWQITKELAAKLA